MVVMGVSGSFDRVDEVAYSKSPVHDASAALVKDGRIIAASEEERFNRCKHSGKLPVEAIRYCLSACGIGIGDVDKFVFNFPEAGVDQSLELAYHAGKMCSYWLGRQYIQHILKHDFQCRINPDRFEFIDHHHAHAASAFLPSGFSDSLVVTLDGVGDGVSGTVWIGQDRELTYIRSYDGHAKDTTQSLGHLYLAITLYLGFRIFDEYKVMGLAPYGNPSRFRSVFERFYLLKEQGDYDIYLSELDVLDKNVCARRRNYDPLEQVHQDLAAALQETVETIAFHVLEFHQSQTHAKRLSLAGGVAQNCVLNGKILSKGLFEEAFVQPASHDGGLSLGGALHGYFNGSRNGPRRALTMEHAYLGVPCGDDDEIERELSRWGDLIRYEKTSQTSHRAAELLAGGSILGWIQGRAEFGPRALGNRSIVADPRPAENKDIINAMIKKREAFRPFAPSILEEYAEDYFDLPPHMKRFPFMVFVVKVREQYRDLLGAITHVDGTARIQTVSRSVNERYWQLIHSFGERTGVPIVLNTSFNNNAEPIVNTTRDALACYLTTGLNTLVVGDYIVNRGAISQPALTALALSLRSDVTLHRRALKAPCESPDIKRDDRLYKELFSSLNDQGEDSEFFIGNTHDHRKVAISELMLEVLSEADGYRSLSDLTVKYDLSQQDLLFDEAMKLWGYRLIRLEPGQ